MASTGFKSRLLVRSSNAMRLFLLNSALFVFIGIWLSGFDQVHWFIYVLPGIYLLSAMFGICPGINLWRILLRE